METIKLPQSKLDKVKWLLNIAKELNILNDKMFDQLMDKYEKNIQIFEFMLESINSMIIAKADIEETKIAFITCLKCKNFNEIGEFLGRVNKKALDNNERLYF